MKLLVTAALLSFAFSAHAQSQSMDCNQLMNGLVGYQGASIDPKHGFKPLLSYQDGKLMVDKTSPAYRAYEKQGNKEIVTYTYQMPVYTADGKMSSIPATGHVELQTTPEGYVVATYLDEAAQNKANAELAKSLKAKGLKSGGLMIGMMATGTTGATVPTFVGTETSVQNQGNKTCVIDQNTMMSRFGKNGDLQKTVYSDKKYCDSVKDTLRKVGKANYEKCEDTLKQAETAYMNRAQELMKEKKWFVPPGQFGMMGSSMSTTMWALNSCSPDEWGKNQMMGGMYGMGMGYYGTSSPIATMAPSESTTKQGNQ